MSRSDAKAREQDEANLEEDRRRTGRHCPRVERAFRWLTGFRSQANVEQTSVQVTA